MNSEDRVSKSERKPKAETRNPDAAGNLRDKVEDKVQDRVEEGEQSEVV